MFGTLAVCLPCKHTGADVELSFQGKKKSLSTSVLSEWSVSFIAWYSDVLHEVRPVTSGHRVVLTYNLVHTGTGNPNRLSAHSDRSSSLRSTLKRWSESPDTEPRFLVYPLEHKYTDHSLALNRLKGNDMVRVQAVATLAEETNIECYLASVEKRVKGTVDDYEYESDEYGYGCSKHEIIDKIDSSLTLARGVSLGGFEAFQDMAVDEDDFVCEDIFDEEPDDEDFSGYTGNEGAETTHWYRKTVRPQCSSRVYSC